MPDPAVPAPVATPAAPVAPAAPAAPAAPVVNSLIPEVAAPAAPAAPVAPAVPADPNAPGAWVLSEGVLGTGERPAWYKADKYKSVAAQAEAYVALEQRFGSFTGAPKDGAYEFAAPEGLTVEFDDKHPLVPSFTDWAKTNQLSQKGYNELVGMLARYEEAQIPNMNEVKAQLGTNADARIGGVSQWAQANLNPEQFALLRQATGGPQAAAVLQVVEAIIGKTRQVSLPKPGADVPAGQPTGEAAIREAQNKKGADGKRLYDTDMKYRAQVEAMWVAHYQAQQPQR